MAANQNKKRRFSSVSSSSNSSSSHLFNETNKKIKKQRKQTKQRTPPSSPTPSPPQPSPTPTPTPSPPPPSSPFSVRPALLKNYTIHEKLGQGTYGCVYRATEISTGTPVAVKMLRGLYYRDQCLALPEIRAQGRHLDSLPNIVPLRDVVHEGGQFSRGALTLVFDLMDCSLLQAVTAHPPVTRDIQRLTAHIARGLYHMHQKGYFHRDIKPENILLRDNTPMLADFGFAGSFAHPPFTDPAGSLWYQAPEVLLGSCDYGPEVDMWALGVVIFEMYLGGRTVFPGDDREDQLNRICQALGCFDEEDWPEGVELAEDAGYRRPTECRGFPIEFHLVEFTVSDDALRLMEALLSWNPRARPTAAEVLAHPFITSLVELSTEE